MTTNMSDQRPDNEGGATFGKAVCVCVCVCVCTQYAITDGYECLIISVPLKNDLDIVAACYSCHGR